MNKTDPLPFTQTGRKNRQTEGGRCFQTNGSTHLESGEGICVATCRQNIKIPQDPVIQQLAPSSLTTDSLYLLPAWILSISMLPGTYCTVSEQYELLQI